MNHSVVKSFFTVFLNSLRKLLGFMGFFSFATQTTKRLRSALSKLKSRPFSCFSSLAAFLPPLCLISLSLGLTSVMSFTLTVQSPVLLLLFSVFSIRGESRTFFTPVDLHFRWISSEHTKTGTKEEHTLEVFFMKDAAETAARVPAGTPRHKRSV